MARMRRIVAAASALLVLHTTVVRAGVLCDGTAASPTAATTDATHASHDAHASHGMAAGTAHDQPMDMPAGAPPERQAPAPAGDAPTPAGHHGTTTHCGLMAACGQAGLVTLPETMAAAPRARIAVGVALVAAPASVTAAPDTPPPRD
jgi:hypothetical protein